MAEKTKPTKIPLSNQPENLPVIYSSLLAYINSIVTYRFTTLGFFLAAVGLILGAKTSYDKYIVLAVITFALYIIEIRNRVLKNDLEAQAQQIEHKWGYAVNREDDYEPRTTYILWIPLKIRIDVNEKKGLTHSTPLDILYLSILIYAVIRIVLLILHHQ
jgi:hypothetical protein